MSPPDDAKRRGRRQFLMVASLFVVPVVTAIVLYRSVDWRPVVNAQGTLIDPPHTLSQAPESPERNRASITRMFMIASVMGN